MSKLSSRLDQALEYVSSVDLFEDIFNEADTTPCATTMRPPTGPTIIDMGNWSQREQALCHSRGPFEGWDEYDAGRDYQPPYFFTGDIPMGPDDGGHNPHSEKYGSVRPWSLPEIIETVIRPGGIAERIVNRHPFLKARSIQAGGKDAMLALASEMVMRKIYSDQSRVGVKWSTFMVPWIETGMVKGVPPGYRNEYRNARGLLNFWNQVAASAIQALRREEEIDQHFDTIVNGGSQTMQSGDVSRLGVSDIDYENPGPRNAFGDFADRLYRTGIRVANAIAGEDPTDVAQARRELQQFKAELADEETTRRSRGTHFDTTIAPQSAKKAPTQVTSFTVQGDDDRESERSNIVQDVGNTERDRLHDTVRRLVVLARKGLFVDYIAAKGTVDEAFSILREKPRVEDLGVEEVQTEGGRSLFNLVSPNGKVLESFDSAEEVEIAKQRFDPRAVMARDIDALADTIGNQHGKYEELRVELEDLSAALTSKDPTNLRKAIDILKLTGKMAAEEAETGEESYQVARRRRQKGEKSIAKPGAPQVRPLSDQEYRVLLRFHGIGDYPERGTADDPEMTGGAKSQWAASGYPKMAVKAFIGKDLGIGKQRVHQLYTKGIGKVNAISRAMFGDTGMQLESIQIPGLIYEECLKAIALSMAEFYGRD